MIIDRVQKYLSHCQGFRNAYFILCFTLHANTMSGKTATLKAILSLFGLGDRGLQRGKVTAEALLKRSNLCSFPTTVDDISSAAKVEIAVTYFNAAGHTTVAGGTVHPRGTVLLSSNKSFVESDRYVCFIAVHGVWFNSLLSMVFTQAILSPHCAFRNASRMVHIPSFDLRLKSPRQRRGMPRRI